jgi:hypothetical protein
MTRVSNTPAFSRHLRFNRFDPMSYYVRGVFGRVLIFLPTRSQSVHRDPHLEPPITFHDFLPAAASASTGLPLFELQPLADLFLL